jgi:small subunit ribosomal protein S6
MTATTSDMIITSPPVLPKTRFYVIVPSARGHWNSNGFVSFCSWHGPRANIHRKEVSGVRDYELAYVVRSTIDEDGVTGVVEQVSQFVKSADGEVTSVDVWGRRALAYPIDNHREGIYVVLQMKMPPTGLPQLERNLKLSEDIIRYLLVKVEA